MKHDKNKAGSALHDASQIVDMELPNQQKPALPLEEQYMTMKTAAAALGPDIGYHKIQRAVKNGLLPHYRLLNGRKLVKLSDILQALNQTQKEKNHA